MTMDLLRTFWTAVNSRHRRLGASAQVMLVAGAFSVASMTAGLAALTHFPFWPAVLVLAVAILWFQLQLAHLAHDGGWTGRGMWVFYSGCMAFSMALSIGAVVDLTANDRATQKAFSQASQGAFAQLDKVTAAYAGISSAMSAVAVHSHAMAVEETQHGGTCGVSIAGGNGPVYRLRARDDALWGQAAADLARTAGSLSAAKAEAEAAIASYEPARHREVALRVNAALDQARMAAASPRLTLVRQQAQERLGQMTTGVPDGETGLVHCSDDLLSFGLQSVIRAPLPQPPAAVDLPLAPSHESAIRGFVAHLASVGAGRQGFDWSLYGFSLIGALPECALLLALAHRRRQRRVHESLVATIASAGGFRAEDLADLQGIAERAAADEALSVLRAAHVEDRGRLGKAVDYLLVKADGSACEYAALALVNAGRADDQGVGPAGAGWATFTPPPADPQQLVRFVRLHTGVWRELMLEMMRAAGRRPTQDESPTPKSPEPPTPANDDGPLQKVDPAPRSSPWAAE